MNVNLLKIDGFYKSDLGRYVLSRLDDYFKSNCDKKEKICVASAGACFYFDTLKTQYNSLVLQTLERQMDVDHGQGHFVQIDAEKWPYRAEEIDHIIMVHDIEFSQNPEVYLHEAWRVLKGEGRLTIIFPNREGRWARFDATPFGKGYPFSMDQMRKILTRTHFAIDDMEGMLFFPPYQPKTKIGQLFRNLADCASGLFIYRPGLCAIKVSKHIHAPVGGGLKEMAKNVGRVLQPKSIATSNHCPKITKTKHDI